jgi:hypothetical protein
VRRSPVTGKPLTGTPVTGKPAAGQPVTSQPVTDKAAADKAGNPRLPGLFRDPLGHRTRCAQRNFLVSDPAGDHRVVVTDSPVVRM